MLAAGAEWGLFLSLIYPFFSFLCPTSWETAQHDCNIVVSAVKPDNGSCQLLLGACKPSTG